MLARILPPLLLLGAVAGCGPTAGTVVGEVRVDGTPVKKGFITFTSATEGYVDTLTVEIRDGAYEIKTPLGKKMVQISVPVVVNRHKGEDGVELEFTDESLPERYHLKSELTHDVQPGRNQKDWILDSKK